MNRRDAEDSRGRKSKYDMRTVRGETMIKIGFQVLFSPDLLRVLRVLCVSASLR